MNADSWDDVRVFLAAMRAPSLRRAAESLGVSHPTARRRLNALEGSLGIALFHRRPDGLHATPQALELMEAALDVERSMLALGRVAQAATPELRGTVRVTLPDPVTELLMPDLVAFAQRWPAIDLHVDADVGLADLARREADIAIRIMPTGKLPDGDLTGRVAARGATAVYGHGEQWIGWSRERSDDLAWVRDTPFPDLPVRGCFPTPELQRQACAAGLGLTRLPCFYADGLLVRRTEPDVRFDLWVLVHPDLRKAPAIRVFRDAMAGALRAHEPKLLGET